MESKRLNVSMVVQDSHKKDIRSVRLNEGIYLVGSNPDVAESEALVLNFPTVSKRHARLWVSSENGVSTLRVQDLGSRNGTFLFTDSKQTRIDSYWMDWPCESNLQIGPFHLQWKAAPAHQEDRSEREWLKELTPLLAQRYRELLASDERHARDLLLSEVRSTIHKNNIYLHSPEPASQLVYERILQEFHDSGPLTPFLNDTQCKEVLINHYDQIYVDNGTGLRAISESFLDADTYQQWAARTASAAGRRLDLQHPICEATLPDGARFHAVLSPVAASGLSVAIRRFGSAPMNEARALESNWFSVEAMNLLRTLVVERKNVVISGGTSTGKTSLLNFLCQYLTSTDRVITVEDTVELRPPIKNLVQLQARNANADGVGEISLRTLVQCALRMRPDRILVGECRGAEVLEMLQALNTGHPGSLTTIHANAPNEALHRLELLALLGAQNLSIECIREWIRSSIDSIVQVSRSENGLRYVSEIIVRKGKDFASVYKRLT